MNTEQQLRQAMAEPQTGAFIKHRRIGANDEGHAREKNPFTAAVNLVSEG